jgi:hypothetical protein
MEQAGLTAKELSRKLETAVGARLDPRTIQNAMAGSCSLDTYFLLVAFFGWDFNDQTMTPFIGASRIASLEREIAHEKAVIGRREAELQRLKTADRARAAAHGGGLRLVSEESGSWAP